VLIKGIKSKGQLEELKEKQAICICLSNNNTQRYSSMKEDLYNRNSLKRKKPLYRCQVL